MKDVPDNVVQELRELISLFTEDEFSLFKDELENRIYITAKDAEMIVDLLDKPPKPNEDLQKAFDKWRNEMKTYKKHSIKWRNEYQ